MTVCMCCLLIMCGALSLSLHLPSRPAAGQGAGGFETSEHLGKYGLPNAPFPVWSGGQEQRTRLTPWRPFSEDVLLPRKWALSLSSLSLSLSLFSLSFSNPQIKYM